MIFIPAYSTAPLSDTLSPTPCWHSQGNGLTPLEIKAKKSPFNTLAFQEREMDLGSTLLPLIFGPFNFRPRVAEN